MMSATRHLLAVVLLGVAAALAGCRGGSDGGTDALIERLGSSRQTTREDAAGELARDPHPAAADALIEALKDESWLVRERAAEALGKLGDRRAVGSLRALLEDERQDVRWSAAKALAAIGGIAIEPLLSALQSDDEETRRNAAAALDTIEGMGAVSPLLHEMKGAGFTEDPVAAATAEALIEGLKDPDPAMRCAAAERLARLRSPRAAGALIEALADADARVRARASEALGAIGAAAVEPAASALQDGRVAVRQGAARALGLTGTRAAVAPLIGALSDQDPRVRGTAHSALAQLWGPGTGDTLTALVGPSRAERAKALAALVASEDKKTAEGIVLASMSTARYFRVLDELGPYGERGAELLAAAAEHQDLNVRRRAGQILRRMKSPLAVHATVKAMEGQTESRCRVEAAGLKALDAAAVGPIVQELGHAENNVRNALTSVLVSMGPPAFVAVTRGLEDKNPAVREGAMSALASFRDPRLIDALIALLDNEREPVRQAAAAALAGTTGQKLGGDRAAWQKWWDANKPN